MSEKVYRLSNKITTVNLTKFKSDSYNLLTKASTDAVDRQLLAQNLINDLCEYYNIPQSRQRKTVRGKICGTYNKTRKLITVYNLTAKLGKIVSLKGFIDTILHEFIHHYDYYVLELSDSLHTAGFYQRISDLQKKLED